MSVSALLGHPSRKNWCCGIGCDVSGRAEPDERDLASAEQHLDRAIVRHAGQQRPQVDERLNRGVDDLGDRVRCGVIRAHRPMNVACRLAHRLRQTNAELPEALQSNGCGRTG